MSILIEFFTITGFPQLQIALVSDHGYIEAFPIDGLAYETFPKLQFKRYDPEAYNNGPCSWQYVFQIVKV